MTTDTFTTTGDKPFDFWLINNSKDWAVIPAGTIKGFDEDLPIRLQVGNKGFGQKHIEFRHSHWLKKITKTVQETLATKLGQSGSIYTTEEDNKLKIMMRVSPDSLLVIRHVSNRQGNFFTVVSLYYKNERVDGDYVGRYESKFKC